MKKIIVWLLSGMILSASSLFLAPITSSAAVGDIAGQYYYTDICTYLNGVEIDAINIGGETLISAEDMHYYSFWVQWYPAERELRVDSLPHAEHGAPPQVEKAEGVTGTVRGHYYQTDIITYLDGTPITAYNIGGRTYMHAEEMRNYGYVVDWSPEQWTLSITSPDRAGYVYDIPLSFGKEQTAEGSGAASITYKNGDSTGQGDADYFDLTMYANKDGYSFEMAFYQNDGLFYSTELQNALRPLVSSGFGVEEPCDPKEKYELVNQTVTISINGQVARSVAVEGGAGNGHRDYYFEVYDLPRYKQSDIKELSFSVGWAEGEPYAIAVPDYVANGPEAFEEKLKKYPLDFMKTCYQTETYYVIYMCESKSLGEIVDRVYIVNHQTGEISADLLEQVRAIEGFHYERLHPFAFSTGKENNQFFFSCRSAETTGDFYVELDSAIVHKRS